MECMIGMPGRRDLVNLYDLPDDAINLEQIVTVLSHINRYNGRGDGQVSVMHHSVFTALIAKYRAHGASVQLGALCHDFGEAFTGDIINPIKQLAPEIKRIEFSVMSAISRTIDTGMFYSSYVKEIDLAALYYEAIQIGFDVSKWGISTQVMNFDRIGELYEQALSYKVANVIEMHKRLCDEVTG